MQDSEFHDEVDGIFDEIELGIDELEDDVDVDSSGGVLTLTFPNGSAAIFSRQVANHEIWIAAKSGGFHLHKDGEHWFCGLTKESLEQIVHRVFVEQLGREVTIL
ncbi:MAG: iron donor protein CyaY [Pseudomonadales bacterium]